MPRAAWCSDCGKWVWIAKDLGCTNGHPRSCLRKEYLAEQNPTNGEPVAPVMYPPPDPGERVAGSVSSAGRTVASYAEALGEQVQKVVDGRQATSAPLPQSYAQRSGLIVIAAVAVSLLFMGIAIGAVIGAPSGSDASDGRGTSAGRQTAPVYTYTQPSAPAYNPPSNSTYEPYEPKPRKCLMCSGTGIDKCGVCGGDGTSFSGRECVSCDGMGHRPCISCGGDGES